jgi:hypothetical protein
MLQVRNKSVYEEWVWRSLKIFYLSRTNMTV